MSRTLAGRAAHPARSIVARADAARIARGAAAGLSLAAAPCLGLMALLCALWGDDRAAAVCTTGSMSAWWRGMVPMYLLMSVLHLGAWLALLAGRGGGPKRSDP